MTLKETKAFIGDMLSELYDRRADMNPVTTSRTDYAVLSGQIYILELILEELN